MDQREARIAALLFEHGYRKRTADETARFTNLLTRQMARDKARQLLLLAEYELDLARRAVDDPAVLFVPAPSRESVLAEKQAEIAESERLMGYVAQAAREVLHKHTFTSALEDTTIAELAEALKAKAVVIDVNPPPDQPSLTDWQQLARTAIAFLATLKEDPNG